MRRSSTHRSQLITHRHALRMARKLAREPDVAFQAGQLARDLNLPMAQDAVEAARLLVKGELAREESEGPVLTWRWAV